MGKSKPSPEEVVEVRAKLEGGYYTYLTKNGKPVSGFRKEKNDNSNLR